MILQDRINAFAQLGDFLSQFTRASIEKKEGIAHNDLFFDGFKHQMKLAKEHNGWFTQENVLFAIEGWAQTLTKSNIETWLSVYGDAFAKAYEKPKTVAIIMAGNIPLVGFHDFMCVLISGHSVVVKQSSNDKHLLPFLAKYLEYCAPELKGKISFTEDKLTTYDAVIATGSDNTARYFEYYFGKKPNIIRKNRNSVAVLTGKESEEELKGLSEDIFRYFGLGCRNVSKLFVPKGYNFDAFFKAMYHWSDLMNISKYANNYDYNKAVYLMSLFDMLENGFMMIKEDKSFSSPIATIFYEYYDTEDDVLQTLNDAKENIQCIVSHLKEAEHIKFGHTQKPGLSDYADGVDTITFLATI